jgi:hypothetical protein
VPGNTLVGDMLVNVGGAIVKPTPLLLTPFCATNAFPPKVPAATVATTCVSLQLTIDAASKLLNETPPPVPCVAPNPLPVIVTCVPGNTLVGDMLVNVGVWAEERAPKSMKMLSDKIL